MVRKRQIATDDDTRNAELTLDERRRLARAAEDFRYWAQQLERAAPQGQRLLLEVHRLASLHLQAADGKDEERFYAWEIVDRLNSTMPSKGKIAFPGADPKTVWKGMQRSTTKLTRIPEDAWLAAVKGWKGRKLPNVDETGARKNGRPPKGAYDYRTIVHKLLNFVRAKNVTLEATQRLLDRMPWPTKRNADGELLTSAATSYRDFRDQKS